MVSFGYQYISLETIILYDNTLLYLKLCYKFTAIVEIDVIRVVIIGVMFTLMYRRIQEDDDENEREDDENEREDDENEREEVEGNDSDVQGKV